MQKIKETKNSITYKLNRGDIYHIQCHYSRKNPVNTLEAITDALAHVGAFEGMRR